MRAILILALIFSQGTKVVGPAKIVGPTSIPLTSGITWTIPHDTVNTGCTLPTSSCSITIPSTTAGNAGILFMLASSNITISSITGATFTACRTVGGNINTCAAFQSGSGANDASYILSLPGGVTSLTVNLSGTESAFLSIEFVEIHRSTGTATLDASGAVTNTTCTLCSGVALTLSGTNEINVQTFAIDHNFGSPIINAPFTAGSAAGTSMGYVLNALNGMTPQWNQTPTGVSNGCALVFK